MRLAHFSDIHVTANPLSQSMGALVGKRAVGSLNYFLGGRRKHFDDVDVRIARLLEDVDEIGVDHALCTGDLTQMSYADEFERCAALFGERLDQPERFTVIPGNHDRYTKNAVGRFEASFGKLCEGAKFPFAKQLAPFVTLVALDVSRPCALWDSSGFCGPEQLDRARAILTDATIADHFVFVALHYGLFRENGMPDRPTHGIRDWRALVDLLDARDVRVDVVIHGHIHRAYEVRSSRRRLICTGSATDLALECGYNVYDIDVGERALSVERRIWDSGLGRYQAV